MTARIWSIVFGIVVAAATAPSWSAAPQTDSTALTLYSSQSPGAISPEYYRPLPGAEVPPAASVPGYAMVRQDRSLTFTAGRQTLRFTDVAGLIDPTTVTFTVPADASVRVLEQNFQFDLVSNAKLLLRYLDRPISVERNTGAQVATLEGTLLSAGDGLVLRAGDGSIHALRDYSAVRFPDLPGGLITQPTLVWDINAPSAGVKRARVTYQTGGMTWWADYNLIFNEGSNDSNGRLDLSAWVSIINQSGATFSDAKLKLIAGEVNRAPVPSRDRNMLREVMVTASKSDGGFEEKAFDEYHLYALGRATTLPNNSTKQIELFDRARSIPARRVLVYDGSSAPQYGSPYQERNPAIDTGTRVSSFVEFRNDAASGLGVPLPAGRVRVSRIDAADGSLEFIGEDVINHTPKDETVRLKLGSAFDVVGERKQLDFTVNTTEKWMEEEIEVRIRNHKAQPVTVAVREPMYRWTNWRIVNRTHEYEKEDARLIRFNLNVPRDGETVLRYRVRYSW
jgi:hypothetical protein